jgi:Flp pilus assembly protein TadD
VPNAVIDAQALDHKHAIEEYQLAIQLAPQEADLYEGLGWEYRQLGHADQAAQAFAQQLKLTPGNPIAMYNLGSAEVDSGEGKEAIPLLQDVVRVYDQPTAADYYLGRALAAEGKYKEAEKEFQRATLLTGEMQQRAWFNCRRRTGTSAKRRKRDTQCRNIRRSGRRRSRPTQKKRRTGGS